MSALTYLDFDLQIDEVGDGHYRARVLNSPAGQADVTFALPFSALELENFILHIGRQRQGMRRINTPALNAARSFGTKLYEAIFQDEVESCLRRSIDLAELQEQGLRLRLRLPPSLIEVPWEFLYDANRARFFAHSTATPIVRYFDLPDQPKALAIAPPLNVLVMVASPPEYPLLDVETEWQKIQTAVATLKDRGLLRLTRLPAAGEHGATLAMLQAQLRREQYHIFHFIGHGAFDEQTQDGVLLLEEDDSQSRLVSGNYLGTILHDESSLRLALLNACEGARTAKADPFAGVAQQLVRQGIPAVIAMQREISDEAAVELTREFYSALVDGYPVDGALAEARKALFTDGNEIEWGTPVLFLRAADGHLFDVITQDSHATTAAAPSTQHTDPNALGRDFGTISMEHTTGANWQRWWLIALAVILLVVMLISWPWFAPTHNDQASGSATSADTVDVPTRSAASNTAVLTSTPSIAIGDAAQRTLLLVQAQAIVDNSDFAAAIPLYEALLAADGADVEAMVGLAWALHYTQDREQEALRFAYQAATLQPERAEVNATLGIILRESFNRPAEAIDYFTKALTNSAPAQRRDLYAQRGWAYESIGDHARAIADWDAVIALDATSDAYLVRATLHEALQQDEAAEADYSSAVMQSPTTATYYDKRAEFYAAHNRTEDAIADYETFLRLADPQDSPDIMEKAQQYIADHSVTPTPGN